jgi:hypothetical protein
MEIQVSATTKETRIEQMIDSPGIYKLSMDEYQADPCIEPSLSRSILQMLIYKSPAHAFVNHPRLCKDIAMRPEEKLEKFDLGSAAHSLFLEGLDIAVLVDGDDWRKKEAREARDKARSEGKIPLLLDQYEKVQKMVTIANKAIFECDELKIGSLKLQGDSEESYFWKEEDIWLRIRPDWVSHDKKIILDYKTTAQSANPNDLARTVINMGYDIQSALYTRGVHAICQSDPKFIFVFQETVEPYLCSIIALPPDFMEMGKSKVEYGIFLWQECLRMGKWPGYPSQVSWINLPAWASVAWEQRATEIGGVE